MIAALLIGALMFEEPDIWFVEDLGDEFRGKATHTCVYVYLGERYVITVPATEPCPQ